MAISALITSRAAIFHRAILHSGTLIRPFFSQLEKQNRTELNLNYAASAGCPQNGDLHQVISCLQSKPLRDLLKQSYMWQIHSIWAPVVDGMLSDPVLPLSPAEAFKTGNFKKTIDIIVLSTSGDAIVQVGRNILKTKAGYTNLQKGYSREAPALMMNSIGLPDKEDILLAERLRYFYIGEKVLDASIDLDMVRLMSDNMYQAGGSFILENMAAHQSDNRLYHIYFDYVSNVSNAKIWFNIVRPELGACHADEIHYILPDKNVNALVSEKDKDVSNLLVKFWTNFAKTGNPNDDNGKSEIWSQYSSGQQYLAFNTQPKMQYLEKDRQRDSFWRTIFHKPAVEATSAGLIKGSTMTSVHGTCIRSYQGIPYAQAPRGQLRLKDPKPLNSWQGTLDATKLKPSCMQGRSKFLFGILPMSEDCLYLNIYRPCSEEKDLPVIVLIHGGGLTEGSGGTHLYGPEFLIDSNIVLVTLNYRLIPFSFISLESEAMPGNQGLKDQRLALKWVQDHIESFGGSRSRVTIYGQGAGAQR